MSYRERPAVCPACDDELEIAVVAPEHAEAHSVERCRRCGGAYFDWFDGDPVELARALDGAIGRAPPLPPHAACPKCHATLEHDGVAESYRCSGCTGLFVTAAGLASLREHRAVTSAGWLDRLGRFLGWS